MQPKVKNSLIMLPIAVLLIGTITGIMTFVNHATSQSFITAWLNAFLFAFMVMLPIGAVLFTLVNKGIKTLLGHKSNKLQNLVHGVVMAILMESIMAITTTITNDHHTSLDQFLTAFLSSFIAALPVGLMFACIMTLVIKPKLEQNMTATRAVTLPQ